MKAFFLVGNKRSGTTLLGRLLNMHPKIFCSRESDAAWVLYRMARSIYADPECDDEESKAFIDVHPRDDHVGLRATLKVAAPLFRDGREDPRAAFERVQRHVMTHGSHVQDTIYDKPEVEAFGDQKPVQHGDPDMRHWLEFRFPEAKFIHIVRHPMHCISSMRELNFVPWWGSPLEEMESFWAEHERWALSIPFTRRLSIRYEDLVARPVMVMLQVFGFLGFDTPDRVKFLIREAVQPQKNRTLIQLPYTQEVLDVMRYCKYDMLSPRGDRLRTADELQRLWRA